MLQMLFLIKLLNQCEVTAAVW